MKNKLTILIIILFLTCVSCNNEKTHQKNFEDLETSIDKTYVIGSGTYVKKKIPFIKIDQSKGEYFRLLEYNGEIRAIKCDNGDLENFEYIDGYDGDDYDKPDYYDKIIKTTNIQLFILEGEGWKPSTKWSINCWGITEFCHDSNGNLYAHYLDRAGNECIDGSKLFMLNQDGSVETTILENKDITSIRTPYKGGEEIDGMTMPEGRAYAYSLHMTENNDVAITYLIPDSPPQLILYDAYTGKKIFETEYLGSDLEKYVIYNEDLIYYTAPLTSKEAPILTTSNLKTGKLIRKSYFGEETEWDPLNVLHLRICLGKEEDIYLCTPNGIYGGRLNQENYDLLMPASELGYGASDYVCFFSIGWERDFYLLYGPDDDNMDLYHYTLEE